METGTKISASAHAVLLGAVLIGNPFRSEPLPISVQEVSVLSTAEFDALLAAQEAPSAETDVALPVPETPEVAPSAPEAPAADPVVAAPAPVEDPQPVIDVPVEDAPPVLELPQEDSAVLAPDVSQPPSPDQSDRVRPEPSPEPVPDAAPDTTTQEAITEDTEADVAQPEQEATAPEESAPALIDEANTPSAAPERALRPPSRRPQRPVATAEAPEPEPEQDTPVETDETDEPPADDPLADAIGSAVAEAQEDPAPAASNGPPLTGRELEGLRVSVANCWNVGTLSTEAQDTKITVFVAMNRDGTPILDTMRLVGFDGGSQEAAARVYRTARSAIARCGRDGFPLPVEKYDQWQEIEMTFNPEGLFWR